MKTKLLFAVLLLFFTITFSQTVASSSGIAVQGIARDASNTVKANENLSFTFEIYYKNSANTKIPIYKKPNVSISTDNFGVFSYVIPYNGVNEYDIRNNVTFLQISVDDSVISDEKLSTVPYAIAAGNGVPTGSIMPFIGSKAPKGWHLCDGSDLPSIAKALIALVGNKAPNLQGMFLRGTGKSPVNFKEGPGLMKTQGETFKEHIHGKGTLKTEKAGIHNHDTDKDVGYNRVLKHDGKGTSDGHDNKGDEPNVASSRLISDDGEHEHTIAGNTAATGSAETRPVNYGVHYIIKL
ncbi:MAG: hypothetical protein COB98_03130 [Flavobacteriaceae bacterium]|nr:MAG: hypothetical protein COB98_03130 [Flavobacteriaceae bacterium]